MVFIIIVSFSSIVFWHVEETSNKPFATRYPFPTLLFGVGLLFDLLSCACYIFTRVTGRFSSGVPGVGFAFYCWAWLACPASFILHTPQSLPLLWLHKLLDLVALFLLSACIHSPGWFLFRDSKQKNTG
ncbi:hypothetical protein FEM03_12445 [Phragmitibacter flavus]|uniref:Uncharacterized protein n=1 Tax=Phragmitibacter flavus TaxID=2576071 RepID=A0A5R8KDZ2_9BACT|nr:hypothetical protein FEM03_12445 [Phragmitibacter flavus]